MTAALEAGYRHIDTAQMYGNEAGVGEAIAASGIPRDELYVTTKLNNGHHRPDDARRAFDESLDRPRARPGRPVPHPLAAAHQVRRRLRVHLARPWPSSSTTGAPRSIGVSNFQPAPPDRIVDETGVAPVVNQVEVHPFFGNEEVRAAVAPVTASPPRRGRRSPSGRVAEDPTITAIADRLGRTPAQVALRWHLQRGDIVFPKSMSPERMRENFDIFDFELGEDDMRADHRARPRARPAGPGRSPDTFDYVPR